MRDDKWKRDEIILALDLYFDKQRGGEGATKTRLMELSKVLNDLPLFKSDQKSEKFRNPAGVEMKLGNFISIDDENPGKGLKGGSKLDKEVFFEFHSDLLRLHRIADEIKAIVASPELFNDVLQIEDDLTDDYSNVKEGQVLFKMHKFRERDKKINQAKKNKVFKETGALKCEACNFDFYDTYGVIGKGFIECHHLVPLSNFIVNKNTRLEDLALLCSNCHRIIHKDLSITTITEFKKKILFM